MGENGLLAPHRVGRNQEKTHDGTIVTDKVNEMWGTDMSQTVTLEEGRAYVFVAVEHANSESSSGGESHPSALTEPDVKLSPHPAPTLRPPVARRVATGQTGWGPAARCAPASASTRVLDV